jgi:hypothetical protein
VGIVLCTKEGKMTRIYKVVERKAVYEDTIYFVEANDEETACKKLRGRKPAAVDRSTETSVAAVGALPEEIEYAAAIENETHSDRSG